MLRLLRRPPDTPVPADMLPAEADRVAAARARVNEEIERQPLARADRPAALEGRNVILAPGLVPVALADLRPLHAGRRIGRDQLLIDRERDQSTDRGEPSLLEIGLEPREDRGDVLALELPDQLLAVLGAEPLEIGWPVAARRRREPGPRAVLVVVDDGRVDRARNCAARTNGGHRRCGTVAGRGIGGHERLAPQQPGQGHPLAPQRAVIETGLAGVIDEAIYEGRVFRTSSHGFGSPRSPVRSGSLVSA